MITKTGFGIYIKDGKKLKKFCLPIGQHPDPIGYTVQDVASQAELDAIVLDQSDEQIAAKDKWEKRKALIASGNKKLKDFGLTDEEIAARG